MQVRLGSLAPRGELGREVPTGAGLEGLEKTDKRGDRGDLGRIIVRVVV